MDRSTLDRLRSEDEYGKTWDKCITDLLVKTGGGLGLGIVFSVFLFGRRSWPLFFGVGSGFGMAFNNCQLAFNQPFLKQQFQLRAKSDDSQTGYDDRPATGPSILHAFQRSIWPAKPVMNSGDEVGEGKLAGGADSPKGACGGCKQSPCACPPPKAPICSKCAPKPCGPTCPNKNNGKPPCPAKAPCPPKAPCSPSPPKVVCPPKPPCPSKPPCPQAKPCGPTCPPTCPAKPPCPQPCPAKPPCPQPCPAKSPCPPPCPAKSPCPQPCPAKPPCPSPAPKCPTCPPPAPKCPTCPPPAPKCPTCPPPAPRCPRCPTPSTPCPKCSATPCPTCPPASSCCATPCETCGPPPKPACRQCP